MPTCIKCGKESHNHRVCPFCFTEYPAADAGSHSAKGARRGLPITISPPVKWGLAALIGVVAIAYFVVGRERTIPTGEVVENVIAASMSRGEAEALLRRVQETAKVEMRADGLAVTFPATMWPDQRAGQLAAAQQYARAQEIVDGTRRPISFYNPDGQLYAKSDANGVMMMR